MLKGTTDATLYVYARDDMTGLPKTSLVYGDMTAYYVREGAAAVEISVITLASPSAAHVDGGFIEVSAANMPGIYRFDMPDAVCLAETSVNRAMVALTATDVVVDPVNIDLNPTQLILGPVVGSSSGANFVAEPLALSMFRGEAKTFAVTVTDADGELIDLSVLSLSCTIETMDALPTVLFEADSVTYTGDNDEIALIEVLAATSLVTSTQYRWRLWNDTVEAVLLHGTFDVLPTSESA